MQKFRKDYFCFQEGFELLHASMSGIPERVPVFAQMHEFAMKELGVNARDFFCRPEHIVAGYRITSYNVCYTKLLRIPECDRTDHGNL